jgi:hypothetical protein
VVLKEFRREFHHIVQRLAPPACVSSSREIFGNGMPAICARRPPLRESDAFALQTKSKMLQPCPRRNRTSLLLVVDEEDGVFSC